MILSRPNTSAASNEEELRAVEDRITDAQQRQAAATKHFNRVRTVCINAQQVRPRPAALTEYL